MNDLKLPNYYYQTEEELLNSMRDLPGGEQVPTFNDHLRALSERVARGLAIAKASPGDPSVEGPANTAFRLSRELLFADIKGPTYVVRPAVLDLLDSANFDLRVADVSLPHPTQVVAFLSFGGLPSVLVTDERQFDTQSREILKKRSWKYAVRFQYAQPPESNAVIGWVHTGDPGDYAASIIRLTSRIGPRTHPIIFPDAPSIAAEAHQALLTSLRLFAYISAFPDAVRLCYDPYGLVEGRTLHVIEVAPELVRTIGLARLAGLIYGSGTEGSDNRLRFSVRPQVSAAGVPTIQLDMPEGGSSSFDLGNPN